MPFTSFSYSSMLQSGYKGSKLSHKTKVLFENKGLHSRGECKIILYHYALWGTKTSVNPRKMKWGRILLISIKLQAQQEWLDGKNFNF